jgi:uracil-DNA glycosylase family 4
MNSRREKFLHEMGLTPVWRKKGVYGAGEAEIDEPLVEALRSQTLSENSRAPAPRPRTPVAAEISPERAALIARMDWSELKAAVKTCPACPLCKTRTQTVFGVGDEAADWMFIGEAPGAEEDLRGEPFVGQAGKLLDNMLAAIGLNRSENVYIANVLKCRPPGNRNPEPLEVAQCTPHLMRQVDLIKPKIIIALGRFAAQSLLATDASIASLRGRLHRFQGVPAIVTYHPAYLLRSLPDKSKAWADLCLARKTMRELAIVATGQGVERAL